MWWWGVWRTSGAQPVVSRFRRSTGTRADLARHRGNADITFGSHSVHQVVYGVFNLLCSRQKFSPPFVTWQQRTEDIISRYSSQREIIYKAALGLPVCLSLRASVSISVFSLSTLSCISLSVASHWSADKPPRVHAAPESCVC